MNRSHEKKRHLALCQVECLDDRTLLSVASVAITPIALPTQMPAASTPASERVNERFEIGMQKFNQQFMKKAETVAAALARRTDRLESASATAFTNQAARLSNVANTQLTRMSTTLQNSLSKLASRFVGMNPQLSLPANEFASNFEAADAAFASNMKATVNAVTTGLPNGSSRSEDVSGATISGTNPLGSVLIGSNGLGMTDNLTSGSATTSTGTTVTQPLGSILIGSNGLGMTDSPAFGSAATSSATTVTHPLGSILIGSNGLGMTDSLTTDTGTTSSGTTIPHPLGSTLIGSNGLGMTD